MDFQDEPDYVQRAKEYQRNYYQRNREQKLAYARERLATKRDEINARRRELRLEKHGPPRGQQRGIQSESKQEYNRRYYLEVQAEAHFRDRIAVLQRVSGQRRPACSVCGESDVLVLTINHINGKGRADIYQFPGPKGFYRAIIHGTRAIDDLDVRCQNCNIRYEYERGQRRLPPNWQTVYEDATSEN